MFIDFVLPLIVAVVVIIAIEWIFDDRYVKANIYMTMIGFLIIKFLLVAKTTFTAIFMLTIIVYYLPRYLFKLS